MKLTIPAAVIFFTSYASAITPQIGERRKKGTLPFNSSLLIALFATSTSLAAADDFRFLLKNSDFSNQLDGWNVDDASDWKVVDGVSVSSRIREDNILELAISESKLSQCVNIEGNEELKVALKFKYTQPPAGRTLMVADALSYNEPDCNGLGEMGAYLMAQPILDWQTISVPNVQLTLGAKSVKLELIQPGERGKVNPRYWDDVLLVSKTTELKKSEPAVELKQLPVGVNLIKNPDFKDDTDYWRSLPNSWRPNGHKSAGSMITSLSSEGGGIGAGVTSQCVQLGQNTNYFLKVYLKKDTTASQSGEGSVRVRWYEHPNCSGRSETSDYVSSSSTRSDLCNPETNINVISEEDGWFRLELQNLQRPKNATSALIDLGQTTDGVGESRIYWDDLSFGPR